MNRRLDGGLTRFGLPGLVLGIGLAWCWGFRGEQAAAQGTPAPGRQAQSGGSAARSGETTRARSSKSPVAVESAGIVALIANSPTNVPIQWLYLIDTQKRAFAIYRFDPTNPKGSVKLEASRQFRWDLDLDQYNNQGLEPADVKARVDALNRANP